jgi:hypothetical protein
LHILLEALFKSGLIFLLEIPHIGTLRGNIVIEVERLRAEGAKRLRVARREFMGFIVKPRVSEDKLKDGRPKNTDASPRRRAMALHYPERGEAEEGQRQRRR